VLSLLYKLEPIVGVPQQAVVQEGRINSNLFIIEHGIVQVYKSQEAEGEGRLMLQTLRDNDFFGERSILTALEAGADQLQPATATCECYSYCDMLTLGWQNIIDSLVEYGISLDDGARTLKKMSCKNFLKRQEQERKRERRSSAMDFFVGFVDANAPSLAATQNAADHKDGMDHSRKNSTLVRKASKMNVVCDGVMNSVAQSVNGVRSRNKSFAPAAGSRAEDAAASGAAKQHRRGTAGAEFWSTIQKHTRSSSIAAHSLNMFIEGAEKKKPPREAHILEGATGGATSTASAAFQRARHESAAAPQPKHRSKAEIAKLPSTLEC